MPAFCRIPFVSSCCNRLLIKFPIYSFITDIHMKTYHRSSTKTNSSNMNTNRNILIFLLFTSLFINHMLFSQEYFNVRVDVNGSNSYDVCNDILALDDGYLIPANYTDSLSDNTWSNCFIKLDLKGDIINSKCYVNSIISQVLSYYRGSLRKSNYNEEYYNVGYSKYFLTNKNYYTGLIYKINSEFDTLWTKTYMDIQKPNDSDHVFYHMSLISNDNLIIAGDTRINSTNYKALLMLVDSSGNEQWRRYFDSGPYNRGINVIPTPDGGFALSCYKWVPQNNTSHNYLIKTDSLGNEQWRRFIGGLYKDDPLYLANSPDSTIVGAYAYSDYSPPPPSSNSYNRIAVVKYNLLGDLIYEKIYGESILHRRVSSITPDNQGSFVVSGYNKFYPPEGGNQYEGSLLKVVNNGDFAWYRQYRHPTVSVSDNYLEGVTHAPDGGFAAVGAIYGSHPDPLGQDIWVIKVDSMGCINFDDCWVGEKELPLPRNETAMLRVHPNPAKDRIQLDFGSEALHLPKALHLYDGFGRLQRTVELTPGQEEANISGLPAGIYIGVAMSREKQLGVFKFVVM